MIVNRNRKKILTAFLIVLLVAGTLCGCNMYGGTISGNSAEGNFNMYGGIISGNSVKEAGGYRNVRAG